MKEKWRDIPKALKAKGLIPRTPDLGGREWCEFNDLVEMRDRLVHAASSRPETPGQPEGERPRPAHGELAALPARLGDERGGHSCPEATRGRWHHGAGVAYQSVTSEPGEPGPLRGMMLGVNDPHVVSLTYRLKTAEHVEYLNPPAVE